LFVFFQLRVVVFLAGRAGSSLRWINLRWGLTKTKAGHTANVAITHASDGRDVGFRRIPKASMRSLCIED
jgi:hypothetical protein